VNVTFSVTERFILKKNIFSAFAAAGVTAGLVLASTVSSPAFAVATLPSTDQMYVISCDSAFDDLTLFSVAEDGTTTAIGNGDGNLNGKCPKGAAWDAKNQTAYFLSEDSFTSTLELWSMDVADGTPTKVSDIVGGQGFYIDFNAEGGAQTQYDGVFYDLDMSTYLETEIASSQVNPDNSFYYVLQAFNFADNTLYAINADNTEDDVTPIQNMLYTVDPATGVVYGNIGPHITGLPSVTDVGQIGSMAFDSAGTGWAIVGQDLYSFDVTTATFTLQGPITDGANFPGSRYSLFIAQPSPDPTLPNTGVSSAPLVGLGVVLAIAGVASLVLVRRRST
jgi:LPXTG-motif cell wall-anchored protein